MFNALRIPRQVIVDNRLTKLQVQPFCARLGAYENLRPRAELVHKSEPHRYLAAWLGSGRKTGTFLLLPPRKCLVGTLVIVDAAKQRDVLVAETDRQQQATQILLGGDRLGEHDGLAAAAAVPPQVQNYLDGFLE